MEERNMLTDKHKRMHWMDQSETIVVGLPDQSCLFKVSSSLREGGYVDT